MFEGHNSEDNLSHHFRSEKSFSTSLLSLITDRYLQCQTSDSSLLFSIIFTLSLIHSQSLYLSLHLPFSFSLSRSLFFFRHSVPSSLPPSLPFFLLNFHKLTEIDRNLTSLHSQSNSNSQFKSHYYLAKKEDNAPAIS